MAIYEIGTLVRCSGAYATVAGVATDPTVAIFKYTDPTGLLATVTPTKDSTGNYHYDVTPTIKGLWLYYFQGTGAVVASGEGSFEVRGSF